MSAMSISVGEHAAVLLAKDALYPAPIAFYVAHELAHIALGHVIGDQLIVDLEEESPTFGGGDDEESAADAFALELLTGNPRPTVVLAEGSARGTARELARIAVEAAPELQIEPGVLAQCYGFSTGDWRTATGSLKQIYGTGGPMWETVNGIAATQLDLEEASPENLDFLQAILGREVS
jgi:hypothetical protein